MQVELLEAIGQAKSCKELGLLSGVAREIKNRYKIGLGQADPKDLAIHRRVSRIDYSRRCAENSAVQDLRAQGITISPGEEISYVVRDTNTWQVDTVDKASDFDITYYSRLLDKAWNEISFALESGQDTSDETNLFISGRRKETRRNWA
jgi:DNA polymerase I